MNTIEDKLNLLRQTKADIKTAIEAKGVTNVGDVFAEYPSKIASIQGGGGKFKVKDGIRFAQSTIKIFPSVDYSELTNMSYMFQNADIEVIEELSVSPRVTNMDHCFQYCKKLKELPVLNTENVTNFTRAFQNCELLQKISSVDIGKAESLDNTFGSLPTLSYALIKNIGKGNFRTIYLNGAPKWGDGTMEGSLQSLKDSLIKYSFDRKSAGMPNANLYLTTEVKARLSESEKQQIINKGYNII